MNKNRKWSEEEIRALTHGEANDYASRGQHYYVDKDWFIWFLANATRYSIFHTFLLKYGNGEKVSYTDLTLTEKIGSQRLKIDSIKATIREGLALGFIEAYKSDSDKRVTLYSFDESIIQEVADFCFMMRRNRMLEAASFISLNSTDAINKELADASLKKEWLDSINNFIGLLAGKAKAVFGKDEMPNIIPLDSKKKTG